MKPVTMHQRYNLRFYIYCQLPGNDYFSPEPSYEIIGEGLDEEEAPLEIHLAHVSPQNLSEASSLNHFEGLCIQPTEEQEQQITAWLEEISGEINSNSQKNKLNFS